MLNNYEETFSLNVLNNIQRPGINNLLEYLYKSDFFIAPCSTKYHLAERGGLCKHSLNVYNILVELQNMLKTDYSDETLAIVALFHDICKVNFYKEDFKNVKKGSSWVQEKVYVIDDSLPLGHGEKSVMILQKYIQLTTEEMLAIRWHMGGFDTAVIGGDYAMSNAQKKCKLVTLLQCADMLASQIKEND